MADEATFQDLIRRVRAGEQDAAAELLRRYEPAIRRTVRVRLREARLRRLLDSMDICQSVLASFFVRAALGRYDLQEPQDLLRLLTSMAHHKLTDAVHKHRAGRRDHRRVEAGPVEERSVAAGGISPSESVAMRELLQEAYQRLTLAERQLLELRQQGLEWAEIGARVGAGADALRKQWARAVDRISREMGLDDGSAK